MVETLAIYPQPYNFLPTPCSPYPLFRPGPSDLRLHNPSPAHGHRHSGHGVGGEGADSVAGGAAGGYSGLPRRGFHWTQERGGVRYGLCGV